MTLNKFSRPGQPSQKPPKTSTASTIMEKPWQIETETEKAKDIRKYYIIAEGLLRDHYELIMNDLNKELNLVKNNMKKPTKVIGGHIYILKAQNTTQKDMFKIGNSNDMKQRLTLIVNPRWDL